MLIVGLQEDVDRRAHAPVASRHGHRVLAGRGTAQVWTVQGSANPVAVISAKDEASLEALARPLPHYGAQSYLAFEGARAIERGAWPPVANAVRVTARP